MSAGVVPPEIVDGSASFDDNVEVMVQAVTKTFERDVRRGRLPQVLNGGQRG